VTFDRKDRKDAYWIYKANWNSAEPFVHITGKRFDTRTERSQTIKVYSNQSEVELFLGGRSLGKQTGKGGIFLWENVDLRFGVNRLEARASEATDRASINIDMGTATPGQSGRQERSGTAGSTPPGGVGLGQPAPHKISNLR
jgi:beta-galactosidase